MATNNQLKEHYKTIAMTCYTANIAYLILRVFYLVLFIVSGLWTLVWYDLATIFVFNIPQM